MAKLLLTDCDGTISKPITGKWIKPYNNQRIIEGAESAIAHFACMGYTIIGVSNQAGVATGHKNLADSVVRNAD